MSENTSIPLKKETRKKLKVEKELREASSYDDLLNEFVDNYGFMSD